MNPFLKNFVPAPTVRKELFIKEFLYLIHVTFAWLVKNHCAISPVALQAGLRVGFANNGELSKIVHST